MKLFMLNEIVGGKRYRTATAALIAGNDFWDGHNFERSGTNTFLLKTPKGAYFLQHQSQWQGAQDSVEPITEVEAKDWYEKLSERRLEFKDAFGVEAEEA